MELISTHVAADFDAFASMVAAQRLVPGAQLFFPGSRERSLRRLLDSGFVPFSELRQRQVDPGRLDRLVLCDCRRRDRLGVIPQWLAARPEIEIEIYDHHPASADDLPAAAGIVDPAAGSTSTLMVEELGRREVPITPQEATLLLMGIYQDTGSLTYAGTSPRDLAAAAHLLERGGDLSLVRRFALFHLDPDRLHLLHSMADALEVRRLAGHRVGVMALELGRFVDELAPLVSRSLSIFELPLLVAFFGEGEGEAVTVIGRGEIAGLDLGEVFASFGGGGHPVAAAARFHGERLGSVCGRVLAALEQALPAPPRAADLMIEDFFRVPPALPVAETRRRLNRWRVNAVPVIDAAGRAVGAVTRQLIDGAIDHDLGERPVSSVMTGELTWVDPASSAEQVGQALLDPHARFALVGDPASGRPRGLISRMDLLRRLSARSLATRPAAPSGDGEGEPAAMPAAAALLGRLEEPVAGLVAAASGLARELEVAVYLVGGLVRDLLLERPNRDLDLVVEGDGLAFARAFADRIGGRLHEHRPFLTAVVVAPNGSHVDVATARNELYRAPAALPEVEAGGLRQDLYRRDFTVNTLALRLGAAPELIDFFGGHRDLVRRTLRVLHSLSFIDDPTRALRAVRLEQRLGFAIAPETERLIRVARAEGIFDHLSATRMRQELIRLLDGRRAVRAAERLAELGLLAALDPGLELTAERAARLRRALAELERYRRRQPPPPPAEQWRLLLLCLAADLATRQRRRLAERLGLAKADHRLLVDGPRRVAAAAGVLTAEAPARDGPGAGVPPHRAVAGLEQLAGEELLLLVLGGDAGVAAWVERYLDELRELELTITGSDLLARGAAAGPALGRALEATRAARLDGEIGADEELSYALARLAGEAP